MERVIAIFLSCALLSASSLLASSVEETYQAALMQEKGEGNLEEAIRLYKQVIAAHEKGKGDEKMAARAQLRIGVCQEKIGLAQARQTYEEVIDEHPGQPQVRAEAAQRLASTHRREATLERPSHLTASAFEIQSLLQQSKQWPSLIVGADSLREEWVRKMQDAMSRLDSSLSHEQMRRQLEAAQRRMKQAERQTAQRLAQVAQQHFLERGLEQQYYHYAYTPPVIPYAYEEVAAVPMQWKFRLDESEHPQRHHAYAAPDFDDADWDTIDIGRAWEDQGYGGYDEGAWYRTRIEVNAKADRPVLMAFGGVDKDAYVYVNGQWVGGHYAWDRPFILDISDQVVRDGENTVALYVYDGMLMGGVYGLINVHQPTDEVATDNFAANRGGRLAILEGSGWPVFKAHFTSGERYRRYAHRPPHIPYAYKKVAAVPVQWKFRLDESEHPQRHRAYAAPDFDDSNWFDIDIGRAWEDQGYVGYDKAAWYRTQIEVDADEGRPVHLAFGGVDNNASVYVNGTLVGEHYGWNTPFILDISEAVTYKGQNAVAVWVYDGMNMGGIYGTIEVIQPTGNENLDRYLANRGSSAQQSGGSEKRSFWSRLNPF